MGLSTLLREVVVLWFGVFLWGFFFFFERLIDLNSMQSSFLHYLQTLLLLCGHSLIIS